MKKAGIITLHYNYNFGAVLQCYALKKTINSFSNISAEVINYVPSRFHAFKYKDLALNDNYLRQTEKFDLFRDKMLGIRPGTGNEMIPALALTYDYLIVGSDQVWNPDFAAYDPYFLDFAPENAVKIAYAASIGKPVAELNQDYAFRLGKFMPAMDFISLREKSHVNYLRNFTDKNVASVLDPTLLLEAADYNAILTEPPVEYTGEKYILLYFINHDDSAHQILSFTNKVCHKYNCRVIHSFTDLPEGVLKNESGNFRFAGPEEFLGLVKNAEMIISNSFHGTIFSILYGKPFYSFIVRNMASRLYDLLDDLGLSGRIIEGYRPLREISATVDYAPVYSRLDGLREQSLAFLQEALGCNDRYQ